HPYANCRLVLIDVPITNATEQAFVEVLVARAPAAFATTPEGDDLSNRALGRLASIEAIESGDGKLQRPLDRVRRYLFAATAPPPAEPLPDVELFSAPGEGRECVEIARRV